MSVLSHKALLKPLLAMSQSQRLAFGLLILERLFPYLLAFAAAENLDASMHRKAKDFLWEALLSPPDMSTLRLLREECIAHAPDTEDYSHGSVSDALNAALVIAELLDFLETGHESHIINTVQLVKDSVYLYVSSFEYDEGVDHKERINRIGKSPLMQAEIQRQKEDLEFISKLPPCLAGRDIAILERRAKEPPTLLPADAMRSAEISWRRH